MKAFPLTRVLALAELRAETASRRVRQAHGDWLRARALRVRLDGLGRARLERLARTLKQGAPAGVLGQAAEAARAHAAALREADASIALAHARWQETLAHWQALDARARALRVLQSRHAARAAIELRRLEARDHDEFAARQARLGSARGRVL